MRPMLAATLTGGVETLRYPLYASVKLDGIRCLVLDGKLMSRNMKPIPNREAQAKFSKHEGYDGELIVGDPAAPDCYRKTMSCVMSQHGDTDGLAFHVFDHVGVSGKFTKRFESILSGYNHPHILIKTADELTTFEELCVAQGHEGVITRDPDGLYKLGRSTMNEQGMVKIKRFLDDEAVVVGVEEQMHNANEATTSPQGYTERSSHKANMKPMGVLGAVIVEWQGKQFRIGSGWKANERYDLWRQNLIGRILTFKYLPIGMKDVPRHPVFLRWSIDQ